jgi:putative peptide zinc metalloprotease protein
MTMTDYCKYPPQLAADVEIAEQRDGDRSAFVIGSLAAGRFLLLRETEQRVLRLLDSERSPDAVCAEFERRHGGALSLRTLTRFLSKLDESGILAGERAHRPPPPDQQPGTQFYWRFKLFNPDRLFTLMVDHLGWVWTPGFVVFSIALMLTALLLALSNGAEVTSYSLYVVREHFLMILLASELIALSHEFAHGLTCKAFGGRVPEIGVLQIYYVLPALYCNVSGIHLIPQRNRRLWVILAGIYWQVMVETAALIAWCLLAPYTLLSDLAFCFFLAGVVDVIFNANPLIKLDGYYFLSQWLRLPNLMDRSRVYWRGRLKRILFGDENEAAAQWSNRERMIYAAFGLLSFIYTVGLRIIIVFYVGSYLADWFHFTGLLLAAVLALFYMRHPLCQLSSAAISKIGKIFVSLFGQRREETMASNDQAASAESVRTQRKPWRRRLVPLTIGLVIAVIMCLPWSASVGNYGTLVAIPSAEAIIRAPESATLIGLQSQPGQQIAAGSVVGRMGDLGLEEHIVQAQSELARVKTECDRLQGQLRISEEELLRADLQLRQRQREHEEINAEQRLIRTPQGSETTILAANLQTASMSPAAFSSPETQLARSAYPAAIAVLKADLDLRFAQLEEARAKLERMRKLFAQGIVPRSELEAAETRVATLVIEQTGTRERLEAALTVHRRQHTSTTTEMNLAHSDLKAATLQLNRLVGELRAMRDLAATLESRRDLLLRKRAQFELVTPHAGLVFGEDLQRSVGQFFQKGAEICRVADTRRLLLRVQVPEREIGDVSLGYRVRLRTRSFPDRTFEGVVSKIGGESERDQNSQTTYRVELMIENTDGLLRPGMTAYARIEFGRQMVGRILLHKIKQVLRPELWLF